jgi:hypothetical protein
MGLAALDLGPIQLKNIAEPVRVYSLDVGAPAQAKAATVAKASDSKQRSMLAPLLAGIVALILVAGGIWYFLAGSRTAPVLATAPTPAEPAHLSIVVLPFTNLSGNPAQAPSRHHA